jgi:hypothetical protein
MGNLRPFSCQTFAAMAVTKCPRRGNWRRYSSQVRGEPIARSLARLSRTRACSSASSARSSDMDRKVDGGSRVRQSHAVPGAHQDLGALRELGSAAPCDEGLTWKSPGSAEHGGSRPTARAGQTSSSSANASETRRRPIPSARRFSGLPKHRENGRRPDSRWTGEALELGVAVLGGAAAKNSI